MHIGMRLLHPAAADHSVSISRQQVQRIFRFSLRSRAGDPAAQRWYSSRGDGTWRLRSLLQGTRVTYVTETFPISRSLRVTSGDRELGSLPKGHGYCPFQCPVEASCAPTFWRRSGLHKKTSYCCYGTTHSVDWITLGKRTRSTWTGNAAEAHPSRRRFRSTYAYEQPFRCIWKIRGDCSLLAECLPGNTGSEAIPWTYTYEIQLGLYIWTPALYRFSQIHRVRARRQMLRHVWLPRGRRSSTGSTVRTLWSSLTSRPETGASQCFYPFEVRTQEETGSTRRL